VAGVRAQADVAVFTGAARLRFVVAPLGRVAGIGGADLAVVAVQVVGLARARFADPRSTQVSVFVAGRTVEPFLVVAGPGLAVTALGLVAGERGALQDGVLAETGLAPAFAGGAGVRGIAGVVLGLAQAVDLGQGAATGQDGTGVLAGFAHGTEIVPGFVPAGPDLVHTDHAEVPGTVQAVVAVLVPHALVARGPRVGRALAATAGQEKDQEGQGPG